MSGRYSFRWFFLLCLLFPAAALLEKANAAGKEPLGARPIEITSSTLQADNRADTALFEGSVVAKTGEMTLYADRMTVFYSEDGTVEKIEAKGGVKLVKDSQVVTSGKAVYLAGERKAIFTDNPRGVKGGNVVTGSKMIYLLDDNRFLVEDSKVFLKGR